MNEPDGYESCQPCKAAETFIIVETLISLQIFRLTNMFLTQNTTAFDFASTYPSLKFKLDSLKCQQCFMPTYALLFCVPNQSVLL